MLLETINNQFHGAYYKLRSFFFTLIYPARRIYNPSTRNFLAMREYANHVLKDLNISHNLELEFDAIMIAQTTSQTIYDPNKQYLIMVGGNTTCYEAFILEMLHFNRVSNNGTYVVGFNPPGIGMTLGVTSGPQDYHLTLKSVVEHLNKNSVPYENIVVLGHSFGAVIGASVAAECHLEGKKLKLIADRTLASVSDMAGNSARRIMPAGFIRVLFGRIVACLIKWLVKYLQLDVDVAAHFTTINTVTPGAAYGIFATEDEVILEESSLYTWVNPDIRNKYIKQFKLHHDATVTVSHCVNRKLLCIIDSDSELTAEVYIRNCLQGFAAHLPATKPLIFTARKITQSVSCPDLSNLEKIMAPKKTSVYSS